MSVRMLGRDGWEGESIRRSRRRPLFGRASCLNCRENLVGTRHRHFCGDCIRMALVTALTTAAAGELVRLAFRWLA